MSETETSAEINVGTTAETSAEATADEAQPEINPIQTIYEGRCESLSGRSTLTFAVGRHPETGALHLRIVKNSGGGMFCDEWIEARLIDSIVRGATELTSRSFQALQPGRSINTAGFSMAVLKALGLIRVNGENSRLHEHVPTETFEKVVTARMGVNDEVPSATTTAAKPGRRKAKGA